LVFYVSIWCEFFFFLFMILELHIWFLCVLHFGIFVSEKKYNFTVYTY
jgi:hypothetical protein